MGGGELIACIALGATPAAREERRSIVLGGAEVHYVLRRSSRRTLALQIDHRGVRVAAPLVARTADVERFIVGHARWLLDRMAARAAVSPPRFVLADGVELPVLGETCRLRILPGVRAARWRLAADGVEELVLPAGRDPERPLVMALRRRALPWFAERVAEFCFRLGKPVPRVALTAARTRWGSCSSRSGIRLHWRLIHLSPDLIDYVVAHEVAHLAEMNHSPRFWAHVANLYPNWKDARLRLREIARSMPLIGGHTVANPEE